MNAEGRGTKGHREIGRIVRRAAIAASLATVAETAEVKLMMHRNGEIGRAHV